MQGYFLTAVGTAALVFATSALLPESKSLGRTLEFVLGLLLAAAVFSPLSALPSYLSGLELPPALSEDAEEENAWLEGQKEKALAEAIALSVAERFSLDPADLRVQVTLVGENDTPSIENVKLYLHNNASHADLSGILRYLQNNYCKNCEVIPYANE
ncbi:MAG: hypothetical protein IJW71_00205 [Clostridia bacterium]|nr:hypothetical protein [Clostridia bacterium]